MSSTFLQAVANRRTRYAISSESTISDARIQEILSIAIKNAPSAFNSQSSRVVLLKGNEHKALWDIVLATLKGIVPEKAFAATQEKIASFAAGYATILFFEERGTVEDLQKRFPLYAEHFSQWSEHHSGLLQFIIWTALEDEGLGVSLQHYNPLIDEKVKARWNIPASWKLISQMPFGKPYAPPAEKEFMPIEERLRIFG